MLEKSGSRGGSVDRAYAEIVGVDYVPAVAGHIGDCIAAVDLAPVAAVDIVRQSGRHP